MYIAGITLCKILNTDYKFELTGYKLHYNKCKQFIYIGKFFKICIEITHQFNIKHKENGMHTNTQLSFQPRGN